MTPDPATLEAVIAEVLAAHRLPWEGPDDDPVCACGDPAPETYDFLEDWEQHVASVLAARLTEGEGQ